MVIIYIYHIFTYESITSNGSVALPIISYLRIALISPPSVLILLHFYVTKNLKYMFIDCLTSKKGVGIYYVVRVY